ncbi:acyl-CoA dehydrogenase, partial [Escherichia coli]|nr:acyl-CoA dehydrogenase [Escherichia coli]
TNAHQSAYMLGLFRTEGTASDRQKGLSQLLVDLSSPGIEIRGIRDLSGQAHFNEVTFDDVFVPDAGLIGEAGDGWAQVTAELA